MRLKSLFGSSRFEIKHFVSPNPPNLNLFALLTYNKRLSPVTWAPTSAQPNQLTDAADVQELIQKRWETHAPTHPPTHPPAHPHSEPVAPGSVFARHPRANNPKRSYGPIEGVFKAQQHSPALSGTRAQLVCVCVRLGRSL